MCLYIFIRGSIHFLFLLGSRRVQRWPENGGILKLSKTSIDLAGEFLQTQKISAFKMVPMMKSNDHWAFLEEIEAPMWVDLTLEGKFNNQNIDDNWFSTHHPFHQCSSHDLKSAFSQLFEEGKTLDFELSVSSSPNLPDSVSRSRGKDFDNKRWKGSCQDFAMDKHNVSEKLRSGPATKLNLRSSFTDSRRASSSKSSLVYGSCLTENAVPNVSATGSSFGGKEPVDSRTSSTIITGISHRQQQRPTEVTSQPLGNSSTLLSVMRRSLRKSCVTRQATRLEVNNRRRQSSSHNSDSSNSSVSSSLNPGFGAKSISSTSEQHLKKNRGIGSFSRMTHAAMNKSKVSSVSSGTLMIQVEDVSSNSRRVGKFHNAKSAHQEASKPKILRAKASLPQKRDEQNACLKLKKKGGLAGTGRCKTAVAGKENAIGRIAVSQKCDGRYTSTVSMVKDQKTTQHKVPKRLGIRSVVSSKQGKNCHPSEGRNLEIGSKRVYLR